MNIKTFLSKVEEQISYPPVKQGIAEELKSHIDEIKEEYISCGTDEKVAEEKAVSQMGEAEEIGKRLNKIHRPKVDWILLVLVSILIGFGITVAILKEKNISGTIFYIAVGILLGICVYFFDYKKIEKYSGLIYLISTVIMLISKQRLDGVGYIYIFGKIINPSTIALPLYIIAFVGFIVNYNKNNTREISIGKYKFFINNDLVKIILLSIISIILVFIAPSVANAVILTLTYILITMLKLIEEKNKKGIIILLGVVFILGTCVICDFLTEPYRFTRVVTSFVPEVDPDSTGYVGMLQKDILEKAKVIGEAKTDIDFNNDIITKESNFTFIYLIGKTGILVSSLLILAVFLTSIKMISNVKTVKEKYGKTLIIGLSILFITQSIISILMNLNLGLKMNVDMPFVTYGRLSFIVNSISIALIFSVYRRKDIVLYEGEIKNEPNI